MRCMRSRGRSSARAGLTRGGPQGWRSGSPRPTSGACGRPRDRRQPAPGMTPSLSPSARSCRCSPRRPRRRAPRLPRGAPALPGRAAPCDRPVAETLEGRDLILVVGSSVFPLLPVHPGPLLPEGAALVAITSDPDEAARAPMGEAIVADVALTLRALLEVGEADRPEPSAAPRARPGEESDPLTPTMVHTPSPRSSPTTGSSSSSRPRAPWRCATSCGSSSPAATTSAPAAASASASRRRWGAARPARPAGGLRARRGIGPVRDHGLWTAVAYEVPVTFLVLRTRSTRSSSGSRRSRR